jgi:hypothetical protein
MLIIKFAEFWNMLSYLVHLCHTYIDSNLKSSGKCLFAYVHTCVRAQHVCKTLLTIHILKHYKCCFSGFVAELIKNEANKKWLVGRNYFFPIVK